MSCNLEVRTYRTGGRHAHGHGQVLVPLQGTMRIEIEGVTGTVGASRAALIPTHHVHRFEPSRDCKLLILDVEEGASFDAIGPGDGEARFAELAPWLLRVLRSIGRDAERDRQVARDAAQVALAGLRSAEAERAALPTRHRRLHEVVQSLDGGAERQPVAELAREAALGRSQFHALFREATGRSPKQFQIERMLEMAVDRLIATDDPIAVIARDCGYENISSFNRLFKRHLGMAPGALRAGRNSEQW